MEEEYFWDYPNEPIGGTNPYYRCCSCHRSDPEINSKLSGHYDDCEWRKQKEIELGIREENV